MLATKAPPLGVPMLEFWEGIYDHVYVALHPFFRIKRDHKSSSGAYEPLTVHPHLLTFNSDEECDAALDEYDFSYNEKAKQKGVTLSWRTMHHLAAPKASRAVFNRAAWLYSISGYWHERANKKTQRALHEFCMRHEICPPDDDVLPAILEHRIGQFLSRLKLEEVFVEDEIRESKLVVQTAEFARGKQSILNTHQVMQRRISALYPAKPDFIMLWYFDCSHFLLAMTDAARQIGKPETLFEGWYASQAEHADAL